MSEAIRRSGMLPRPARATLLALACGVALAVACSERAAQTATAPPDASVRSAIEAHIDAAGRTLRVEDPAGQGGVVELVFDHVHDGVKDTGGGRQLACVDFHARDGTLYDVDYYVRGSADGEPVVDEVVVHEVDGENILSEERQQELDRAR